MKKKRYIVKMDPDERRDPIIREFLTRDLGEDMRRGGGIVRIGCRSKPTSILLPPPLIEKLRAKASKRGIGYQTMLKIIVTEHVDEY